MSQILDVSRDLGLTVFERGWLSSNNILFIGKDSTALVDTGYSTHSEQTIALVQSALKGEPLEHIVNTHLHSDHCGGNAALQHHYGSVQTHIPYGLSAHVANWNEAMLGYQTIGQDCQPFTFQHVLRHDDQVQLGDVSWQVHASPGHDPHSIILFEPKTRTLISADSLWQNGFGVIFPEVEGEHAFDEAAQTLDAIERLKPQTVIPGHGAVFGGTDVGRALSIARQRLDAFVQNPIKNTRHAVKVLLKYKLLELQQIPEMDFMRWAKTTPYFEMVLGRWFEGVPIDVWLAGYIEELIAGGAARREGGFVLNV